MSQETVTSGAILDKLKKFISEIFGDLKTENQSEVKDKSGKTVGYRFTAISGNDHKAHVKVLESNGVANLYDVYIVGDNGVKAKKVSLTQEKVNKFVEDFIDKNFEATIEEFVQDENTKDIDISDEAFDENIEESKKIQVTLSKVTSSQEVVCGKIYCNYDALDAYEDLESLLDESEFVDSLSEEPVSYEIIPLEEEYTIEEIPAVLPMNCVGEILKAQLQAIVNLHCCTTCCRQEAWDYIQIIRWQFDWLLQSKLAANVDMGNVFDSMNVEPQISILQIVENYATVLDLYYPNFDHEIQALLDEWLLTLRF